MLRCALEFRFESLMIFAQAHEECNTCAVEPVLSPAVMRIVFLTHEPFYPPTGGGSAEAVYLVQELVRRGHEVHVFCPRVQDPDLARCRFGVELHEFKAWPMGRYTTLRSFKYLLYPLFLERMVVSSALAMRFDLIFAQHAIVAVAAGRLKRKLHVPVVMNFLDCLTGFMETWPGHLAPKPLLKAARRFEFSLPLRYQADAVLTVSDTLADYLAGAGYPRAWLLPIYYGYDADLFPLREPAQAAERSGQPIVVMHGSFDRHHLGPIAAEAVARVAEWNPAIRFRFVGRQTPTLYKFIRQIQRRAPRAQVECTGFFPYAEIALRLAEASVGIVPYEESTGTHCAFVAKMVEYLGLGLPVVCTPLNGVRRYFKQEPLVSFSGFDGASFGEGIIRWLNEPPERRYALARPASERVRANLDWHTISRRAIDFVDERRRAWERNKHDAIP
jgi:glycosyltransferase involved in cell wall biosynthesis